MIKAQIAIKALQVGGPVFEPGTTKVAIAQLSNPTIKQFTYATELYLGIEKVATSGEIQVTIPATSYANVSFPITMPLVEGEFPVYLEVKHEGELLKLYQATENITLVVSPDIIIGPIIWD